MTEKCNHLTGNLRKKVNCTIFESIIHGGRNICAKNNLQSLLNIMTTTATSTNNSMKKEEYDGIIKKKKIIWQELSATI